MDEVLDRLLGRQATVAPNSMQLPIDIFESEGRLMIKALVPGVAPSELDVQIENNILTIRGESKSDYEATDTKVYRREVSYGAFARSIRLPENLNFEQVDAEFRNGFVMISIPKLEVEKPKSLKVNVRAASEITSEPALEASNSKKN